MDISSFFERLVNDINKRECLNRIKKGCGKFMSTVKQKRRWNTIRTCSRVRGELPYRIKDDKFSNSNISKEQLIILICN